MKHKTEEANSLILCLAMVAAAFVAVSFVGARAVSARTYTTDADFDEGVLVGVEHETVHDQLQLSKEAVTLPFIWVPNQGEGTVSKVDTETGKELGRYRVGPASDYCSPSRTTVDLSGNCWVGNRYLGTVVLVGLLEAGQWIDRNGNGVADTSQDLNNDGDITGAELLPWGQDECVLYEVVLIPGKEGTFVPGTYAGGYEYNDWGMAAPRGLAIDASDNLWAGTWNSMTYYYIDGATGAILDSVDVSPWAHHAYGAVIDGSGVLWSSGQAWNHILRLDPSVSPPDISVVQPGHFVYGMGVDYLDNLFVSGWDQDQLSKVDTLTSAVEWTYFKPELHEGRGVACTSDNDVWVVSSSNSQVCRYDNDGNIKATISTGLNYPTGVAVDAAGKVWACNLWDDNIVRIDPATNTVDLTKAILGSGGHNSYSDMTGVVAGIITTRTGTWTVIYNSGTPDTPWGTVSWNSDEPTGTTVTVQVRSSNDQVSWSLPETAINGVALSSTPAGRYIQIETTLQITSGDVSPVLYDLTVLPTNQPPIADPDGPYEGDEGSPVTFDGTGSSDPDGDILFFDWDFGDGSTGTGSMPSHTYVDNGTYSVSLTVTDILASDTQYTTATIANVPPTVGPITLSLDLVEVGSPISAIADFTDPGTADTHTAEWDWGDGTVEPGTVNQGAGSGSVTDSHTYTEAGVYTITLAVTDNDGGIGTSTFQYVVVFVASTGFVTGGGWIDSPSGAYTPDYPDDEDLTGRANFGFVSKYKKGANVPTGNTEFQFHAGDLNFHSSDYDWLVVTGNYYARYKGTGTINGEGDYKFMLWAGDDEPDVFRIKIWTEIVEIVDELEVVLEIVEYDNGFEGSGYESGQPISGGNIIVHTSKK